MYSRSILGAVGVVLALTLGGCVLQSTPITTHPSPIDLTPDEVQSQLLTHIKEVTDIMPGPWMSGPSAYDPDPSVWNPDTSVYGIMACTSGPDGRSESASLDMQILGPAPDDPKAAAQKVLDMWAALGYPVTVAVSSDGSQQFTEVGGDLANGVSLTFSASTQMTAIDVTTSCTTDATLWDWYRARFP